MQIHVIYIYIHIYMFVLCVEKDRRNGCRKEPLSKDGWHIAMVSVHVPVMCAHADISTYTYVNICL